MPAPPAYASFLVRLWREGDPERGTPATDWQGEVEHIQTSQRWTFSTLDDLLDILRQSAEEPVVLQPPADS
jgi:hypothetical protein